MIHTQLVDATGMSHLTTLQELEELTLLECSQVDDGFLGHLGSLTRMTILDISCCSKITVDLMNMLQK